MRGSSRAALKALVLGDPTAPLASAVSGNGSFVNKQAKRSSGGEASDSKRAAWARRHKSVYSMRQCVYLAHVYLGTNKNTCICIVIGSAVIHRSMYTLRKPIEFPQNVFRAIGTITALPCIGRRGRIVDRQCRITIPAAVLVCPCARSHWPQVGQHRSISRGEGHQSFAMDMQEEHQTEGWSKLVEGEFLNQNYEPYWVDENEDTKEVRIMYGFGNVCPFSATCKSFKDKKNKCLSAVCADFARNYLAKHCYDSINHPDMMHNKEAAMEKANEVEVIETQETAADREWYRNNVMQAQARKADAKPKARCRTPIRRGRRDQPRRGRSRSGRRPSVSSSRSAHDGPRRQPGPIGEAPRGSSGLRGTAHRDAERGPTEPSLPPQVRNYREESEHARDQPGTTGTIRIKSGTSASGSTFDNNQKGALARVTDSVVPIKVSDLKTLSQCLERCGDTQKRLLASLTYFQRQFEDERKITEDAKTAIDRMVATSMVMQGGGDFV